MSDDSFGKLCAVLAALSWAVAVPLLQRGSRELHPVVACIIRNLLGILWLTIILLPQDVAIADALRPVTGWQLLCFAASGVIGIALADTFFFLGARHLQVGVIGLTNTVYSPLVVVLSALFLDERLRGMQLVGGSLVIAATVLLKITTLRDENRSRNDSLGFFFMVAAVLANVASVLMLKVSIGSFPVPLLMPCRNLVGIAPLLLWAISPRASSRIRKEVLNPMNWRKMFLAALFGSALSSTLWVLGFAYTKASIAALLNESSAIFMLLIGYFVLGERLSRSHMVCAGLATVGLCLLWL